MTILFLLWESPYLERPLYRNRALVTEVTRPSAATVLWLWHVEWWLNFSSLRNLWKVFHVYVVLILQCLFVCHCNFFFSGFLHGALLEHITIRWNMYVDQIYGFILEVFLIILVFLFMSEIPKVLWIISGKMIENEARISFVGCLGDIVYPTWLILVNIT